MTTEQTARLLEGAAQALRSGNVLLAGQLIDRARPEVEEIARVRASRMEHVSAPLARALSAVRNGEGH